MNCETVKVLLEISKRTFFMVIGVLLSHIKTQLLPAKNNAVSYFLIERHIKAIA